jgi:signal transduction histidine kinase
MTASAQTRAEDAFPRQSEEGEMIRSTMQLSSLSAGQITRNTILRVMAGGFALVILLLVAAAFEGIESIQSIQKSVARLEQERTVTTRLIEEIQGEQAALSAVFYKLSRDPQSVDRDAILAELDSTDQRIEHMSTEIAGTQEEGQWRELEKASAAFAAEARRLLSQEDSTTLVSRNLFHRHDQVISIVARLVADTNHSELEVQAQIAQRVNNLLERSSILLGTCLLLALGCSFLTVRITTRLFHQMQHQASELGRVSWQMLQTQESVARRFSHELHDELGQSLAALKANLAALAPGNPSDANRLADSAQLVDEAIRNVRELSQLLRPTVLDDFGLDASLRWLAERFTQRTGITVHYDSDFHARLADQSETHLYRIAQEALTNVARHSGAHEVWMKLGAAEQEILFEIRDDGKGMALARERRNGGLGIVSIEARARSAGGQMRMESAAGAGLRIEVRIPRQQAEEAGEGEEHPHLVGR